MSAAWFLVQHVADLRRREPRNVGVILRGSDGSWHAKFLGEDDSGEIDSKLVPRHILAFEPYLGWVDYFRRKLTDDGWRDVERMQGRRKGNYFAAVGGQIFEDRSDWVSELTRLYGELVALPEKKKHPESPLTHIRGAVDRIFDVVGIAPRREVQVDADYDGRRLTVPFRYEYLNGQPHLMDIVHVHAASAAADARELRSRVEAAARASSANSFFSFYASSLIESDRLDAVLLPIEYVSTAVDVDDESAAVETLREATGSR